MEYRQAVNNHAQVVAVGVGDRVSYLELALSVGIYVPDVGHSGLVAYITTAWHHSTTLSCRGYSELDPAHDVLPRP